MKMNKTKLLKKNTFEYIEYKEKTLPGSILSITNR